jgi:hypothetical protein
MLEKLMANLGAGRANKHPEALMNAVQLQTIGIPIVYGFKSRSAVLVNDCQFAFPEHQRGRYFLDAAFTFAHVQFGPAVVPLNAFVVDVGGRGPKCRASREIAKHRLVAIVWIMIVAVGCRFRLVFPSRFAGRHSDLWGLDKKSRV